MAFDPSKVQKRGPPEVTALEADIDGALSEVFGDWTSAYNRYRPAVSLYNGPHILRMGPEFGGRVDYDFKTRSTRGSTSPKVRLSP